MFPGLPIYVYIKPQFLWLLELLNEDILFCHVSNRKNLINWSDQNGFLGGRELVKYIFSISDLHVIAQFILVKFTQAYLFLFAEYSSYQIVEKRSSKLKFKIKIFSI